MLSYEGKLWIAFTADVCAQASIFIPGGKDWQYTRHIIPVGRGDEVVHAIEAIDMDQDGTTDLFLSIPAKDTIKIFSFVKTPSIKSIAASTVPGKEPVGSPSNFSMVLSINYMTIFILLVVSLVCTSNIFKFCFLFSRTNGIDSFNMLLGHRIYKAISEA